MESANIGKSNLVNKHVAFFFLGFLINQNSVPCATVERLTVRSLSTHSSFQTVFCVPLAFMCAELNSVGETGCGDAVVVVLFGEGVGGGWGGGIKSFLFTFLFAFVYVPKNCPNRYRHVLRHTSPLSRRCCVVFFSVSPTTPWTSVYRLATSETGLRRVFRFFN